MDCQREPLLGYGFVKGKKPRVVQHVISGGSKNHQVHGTESLCFVHLTHSSRDVVQIDYSRPFETLIAR